MFYRIIENNVYDYADYNYAEDCLFTDICTMQEFNENKDNYTCENGELELLPNLDEVLAQRRQAQFEKEFFNTSLGWIRRKVTMQDGSIRDFLADLLLPIKAGLELNQDVRIITYKIPDFTREMTKEYMESLQEVKLATPTFVQECLFQTVQDFGI